MSGAASPTATTARTRRGSAPIGDRSTPLRLPPAISTSESKARIAADAACGVVAFESLNQRTPSRLPDRLEPVGRRLERRQRVGDRVRGRQPGLEHERRRGQRVGDVVRQAPPHRRRSRRSDRRARPASRARRGSRRGRGRTSRGGPERRRAAPSRPGRRRIRSRRRPAAGAPRSRALAASYVAIDACQLRWSGARLSHAAASARNCSSTPSRKLVHSTTKASSVILACRVDAVDERDVGVAERRGAHAGRARGSRR